jgi:hypothetical protein
MAGRLYLYGIVRASDAGSVPRLAGIEDRQVAPVAADGVAALASPVTSDRIRPSRANVHAHHHVVGETHASVAVLPIRFGTVLADERSLTEELLRPNADRFGAGLGYVEGKDEYRLKATYLPEVTLREIVARNRRVRRMRERLADPGRAASRAEMIELGELVAAEMGRIREGDAGELIEDLAPHTTEVVRLPDRSDTVAVHAALLVARGRRDALSAQVERLGDKHRDRMTIELIGPLAPWDFAGEEAR